MDTYFTEIAFRFSHKKYKDLSQACLIKCEKIVQFYLKRNFVDYTYMVAIEMMIGSSKSKIFFHQSNRLLQSHYIKHWWKCLSLYIFIRVYERINSESSVGFVPFCREYMCIVILFFCVGNISVGIIIERPLFSQWNDNCKFNFPMKM